jgi:hypothetical protein
MKKFKDFFAGLSKKQKITYISLVIVAFLLTESILLYAVTNPGVNGLFEWVNYIRILVYLICLIGLIFPIIAGFIIIISQNMNPSKKIFKSLMILAIFNLIIPLGFYGYTVSIPAQRSGDKPPQLLLLSGSGINGVPNMAVSFWTKDRTTSGINWGPTSSMGTRSDELTKTKIHSFLFDDLLPNITYFYQINDAGQIYNFTTMPNLENTYKFMTSSDPHFGVSDANRTATNKILDQLADPANKYQSFYMLGDMVEYGNFDFNYKEACDTFSPITSHIPFRPVIGNHDILLGGHTFWEDYFSPDLIEDAPRDYFHIEVNGIHIFVLDLEWGTESYCDAQKEWFENELENTDPDDWILVMSHAFYYASGYHVDGSDWWDQQDMIDTFEPIFIENGIDMVFSGHNHIFEVLENNGIYYNIVGGLGGIPDRYYDDDIIGQAGTGSIYYSTDIFGFLEVEIQGDDAYLAFRTPENQTVYNYTVNRL